jgi:hypothetical protein
MNLRLLVVMAALVSQVAAHALDVATARVTLRDAHVDVIAEWDLFLLVEGNPTAIATASETLLHESHAKVKRVVETQSVLRVDGETRRLEATGFPGPDEFRALAATLSSEGHDHGARVRLRLEAPEPVMSAKGLTLAFPAALGPVVVTFVQPATNFAAPGASSSFSVLARQVTSTESRVRNDSSLAWAFGLGAAASFAALVQFVSRVRKPT